VNTGSQTLGFAAAHYVDITEVREKKKAVMENFRGREVRVAAAEAFTLLPSARGAEKLPGT